MDVIYLTYGLSFLALGIAIMLQLHKSDRFELCAIIWLLATFGILHGSLEWMDLWTMIRGENPFLTILKPFLLLISYLFLVEFGRRLVRTALHLSKVRRLLDVRMYFFLIGGLLLAVSWSDHFLAALVLWSRYLVGFTGSMLASIGFLLYYRRCILAELLQNASLSLKYASYAAAFSFITYAVFGGLVVPAAPWFPANWLNQESFLVVSGIPVQFFRAACALLAVISVTHIMFELRILNLINPRK